MVVHCLFIYVFQLNLDLLQPVLSTKEFNKHSVSIMLDVFSDTCKIHTAVMMYKDQLEQYILKDQNNHLYSLSSVLQTAANILEGIEVTNKYVVTHNYTKINIQCIGNIK